MKIKAQNIVLRDMRESDIDDDVRWNTTETEWGLWDAPWETEEEIVGFDEDAYRKKEMESLQKPLPEHRLTFEIETADGVHIGGVSSYCIDEDCQYLSSKPDTEEERKKARWAVGLDICESAYWSGGWGTQALAAWVRYYLENGYSQLYTQTWSGNFRMIGLAEKLGFRECRRKKGIRQVRGGVYDGLTFALDHAAFEAYCAEKKTRACVCMVKDPARKEAVAASVLAELPDWFGLPESTAAYIRGSRALPFWAVMENGQPEGFIALKETGPRTAELYVMGVRPHRHRAGLGRKLFRSLRRYAVGRGYAFLQVKTVQEGHYTAYDKTIAFYKAMGFTELECFPTLWDAHNPCQVLIMALPSAQDTSGPC